MVFGQRGVESVLPDQQRGQRDPRPVIGRRQGPRPAQGAFGLAELAERGAHHAEVMVDPGLVGLQPRERLEGLGGGGALAHEDQGVGQLAEGEAAAGRIGCLGDRTLEAPARAPVVAPGQGALGRVEGGAGRGRGRFGSRGRCGAAASDQRRGCQRGDQGYSPRMTLKALTEIFAKQGGAAAKGGRVELPAAADVTLFAAIAHESLVVERVKALDLETEYLVAHTARNERFVLAYDDIRAVRFSGGQSGAGYAA